MTSLIRLYRSRGFTLIELMVAMVLGLLVAAGIVTVFLSTSSSNRAQNQLAKLQEEGRYAIGRIGNDLSMANGQYCTNSGGTAKQQSNGTFLDGLRAPKVFVTGLTSAIADVTTTMNGSTYPAAPSSASYTYPSFLSMRGYDCTTTTCTPTDPKSVTTPVAIPAMGTAVGDRVKGSAVLTVRYVDSSSGWTIGGAGTSIVSGSAATGSPLTSVTITPLTGEPPAANFKSGDLALLADCSAAQIFAVTVSGSTLTPDTSKNGDTPTAQAPLSAPKLFDFNRDYKTVTYYLQVVDNGNGQTTGALIRRVNGGDPTKNGGSMDEIVRGIERMDFKYGVEDVNGNTSFLTASQVDAATNCPPSAPNPLLNSSGVDPGCMWRAVKSIEVNILMDGQLPLYTLAPSDMQYSYASDATTTARVAPGSHGLAPSDQGFVDQMIRREFTAVIAVRNFNP